MRRQDKKINMDKVNKLFEKRVNESKFNWDGKYANESTCMSLGDDIECNIEEEEEIEEGNLVDDVTDVENTQAFSTVDAIRLMDKEFNT